MTEPSLCPYCGGPHEPGQEYCLECGSRLPRSGSLVRALAGAWRRVLPWYPGDWIWPSLAALVIAGIGAAVAIASTGGGGGGGGPETIVATAPFTTLPPPAPAPPPPSAPTAPKPVRPHRPGLIAWPGGNGYTVVLSSLPASGGLAAARAKAKEALAAGVPQVGVLRSDGFSSLHPGYYVVFSGVYVSLDDAVTAATGLHGKAPAAYARQIAR